MTQPHAPDGAPPTGWPFLKVHGAGNDFVLLPDLDDALTLRADVVRALCDRRRGIGGDGVIRVGRPRAGSDAHVFMDYRNADGSVAEMCGNGVRTVAKYAADRDLGDGDVVAVDTRDGTKVVECQRDGSGRVLTCTVDMGPPRLGHTELPLTLADGSQVVVTTLSMGNPHAVVVVDDVTAAPVAEVGAQIERHHAFPDGTNVEFIAVSDPRTVQGRIWERGVGETLASGTGGSAMAVAAAVGGMAERDVAVVLPGGILQVRWTEETLYVTGPAEEVAMGHLDTDWLAGAGATA